MELWNWTSHTGRYGPDRTASCIDGVCYQHPLEYVIKSEGCSETHCFVIGQISSTWVALLIGLGNCLFSQAVCSLRTSSVSYPFDEVTQSCPTLSHPMDCSLPGSSVCGIFQARILEWVAISFSRGSSQPRDQTRVSLIVGRHLAIWATKEVQGLLSRKAVYIFCFKVNYKLQVFQTWYHSYLLGI